MNEFIYLDYNATTPLALEVKQEMIYCMENYYANTSSVNHYPGFLSNLYLEQCRQKVADLIDADKDTVFFTSGASESNNMILKGVVNHFRDSGSVHIITSTIEHKCILNACHYLEKDGVEITFLPVSPTGVIDLEALQAAIRPDTRLISVMAANNETGVLQPISEIAAIAKKHGILFHTDAAQMIGKQAFSVKNTGADLVSFSAHKFYGPKGIGGLYCANNGIMQQHPLIHGGGQEQGLRGGTVNLLAISGMAKAAEIAKTHLDIMVKKQLQLKKSFINKLLTQIPEAQVNGCQNNSLANTINFSLGTIKSSTLLNKLKKKLALSSGSACSSADQRTSHVLRAMGLHEEHMKSSIRLSFGRETSEQDLNHALALIEETYTRLGAST